ncbi:MAG TPA: glycosyltransferase [Steroidobacteraceae bacterium]|jgi:glycosyltransferase involved in cell wall biosynthesis|nr:glycosyltransferase [Steroidobacteraceae bacterium]
MNEPLTLVTAREAHAVTTPACDVLFVLSSLAVGGSERKIARMANRLKEEGMAVNLACLNAPYTLEPTLRRDVPLTKLERRGKFSLATVLRLRQLIVRDRPATVVAVNLYQALYVACATFLLPHRPRIVALVNTSTFRGRHFRKRLYQSVLARFDQVVHGSQAQSRFWQGAGTPAADKSTVIYNGVDSAHFEPIVAFEAAKRLRASLGVKPGALLLGSVGRLAPEKNHEVLLTTLRRLRVARVDAHLVIAGNGPLREKLLRRAAELEIADRVNLVGEFEDVRPVLAAIDVFVLPSIAVESFSNAALEAMSMGRPVILSDIGGAREMIDDGVEGYVVSATELPARLPAIIAALYSDTRKRQGMGAAARARAVSRFSVAGMAAAYRGLLHGGVS